MNESTTVAPERPAISPSPPVSPPSSKRRIAAGLIAAGILGAAAIFSAFQFQRPTPVEPPHAEGLTVESGPNGHTVTVRAGAPHWKVLKLACVEKAGPGWTDPVPGRVKIDDRLASKIGVTLNGRVSKVFVDLGQRVKQGDPLFAVASPDFAELRAQKEKTDVDLQAAQTVMERVKAMVESQALPAKEELLAMQQLKQAEVAQKLAVAKLEAQHMHGGAGESSNEFVVATTTPRASSFLTMSS